MNPLSRWVAAVAGLSLAVRFRLAAAFVAVGGLAWALWVRLTVAEAPVDSVPLARLRVEERQLEIIGGKFAVESARLSRWFDDLWVGRNLALTVSVLAIAIALFLLWLASVAAVEPRDDDPRDRT